MTKLILLILITACDIQALSPGDRCWWKYTTYRFKTDTVWNQIKSDTIYGPAFILVKYKIPADSARVCRD